MRYLSRVILPGGLGFAVAVLVAACGGGSGLLSANQSTDLNHQLDAVASAISAGQCGTASSAAQGFNNSVANLTSVNPTLTNNLKQASSALAQQAGPDCQSRQTPSVPTTTKPKTTSSATTTTKTTSSTPSTTTPATSTPTNTATGPANTATSPATTTPSPGNTTTNGGSGGAGVGGTGTSTGGSGGASPGSG